jgi:hypothetical protein
MNAGNALAVRPPPSQHDVGAATAVNTTLRTPEFGRLETASGALKMNCSTRSTTAPEP